jgi:hypothetical protein
MCHELSDEELTRIERLAEAATVGPWIAISDCVELGICNELGTFACIELSNTRAADRDFIASARQDVPMLLREVRILKARLQLLLEGENGAAPEPGTVAVRHQESLSRTSAVAGTT